MCKSIKATGGECVFSRLNPCSNGICVKGNIATEKAVHGVLILVLMEYV